MANSDTYLSLRRMTGEVTGDRYTDTDMELFLDAAADDLNVAAGRIWREKASIFAELVDTSEAGSSRKNSDLYKNAIAQAEYFESQTVDAVAASTGTTTTRRIVRA